MYWPNRHITLAGYILVAVSFPLSVFGMSLGIIILAGNWIVDGHFRQKYEAAIHQKAFLLILSVYLIHVLWLVNTSDIHYGLADLRVKLPLLVIPLIAATGYKLTYWERKTIMVFFILGLLVSALISLLVLTGRLPVNVTDARQASLFVSHIRLALMINLALFSAFWYLNDKGQELFRHEKIFFVVSIVLLILYIFILKSFTGIILFLILDFLTLGGIAGRNKKLRKFIFPAMFFLALMVAGYLVSAVSRYCHVYVDEMRHPDSLTRQGNLYENDLHSRILENGHYVFLSVCEKEMKEEWNKRSSFGYDGTDKKNQQIRFTLMRYLTSKGLKKDAEGVKALTDKDIHNIESGLANYIYADKWRLYPYVYQVIWEIDVYRKGANPSGHSVTQRIVYLEAAWDIIRQHPWLGVGTGNVKQAFAEEYAANLNFMAPEWRKRAHNQFVTFWIAFGLPALLWILYAIYQPVVSGWKKGGYAAWVFALIFTLSMFNEDTLETLAGATFFAFFYALYFIMEARTEETGTFTNPEIFNRRNENES